MGEVTYQRIIYEVNEEDGTRRFVYLLDETLELDHVGLISTNMAELLVKGITELSYRECASQVSEMTRTEHQCDGRMERHSGVRGKGL